MITDAMYLPKASLLPTTERGMSALEDAFKKAVKERLDEIAADEIQKAQERVAKRVPEVVAGVALNMMKCMNMQWAGPELRIAVTMREYNA